MPPGTPRVDSCHDTDGCPSPPSSPHGHSRMVTALAITASVLVFLALVSLSIYCLVRRRRRRRQEFLLAAEAAIPGVGGAGPETAAAAPGAEGGGEEEEEVVHHAWHIRTVGLDEAAIESIALTRYPAGAAGMLGAAADCSVCLGEFQDGELLRLLPKCGHAFHVPCIDTWLRAHVNCPLCRAGVVLDPASAADSDPPAAANADTGQAPINNIETSDHEQPGPGHQQNEHPNLLVQIDQRDQSSSPEPLNRPASSRVQNFRRVASMDASIVSDRRAPEDEQSSKENQWNDVAAACCKVSSGSGRFDHMKRSLSGGGRWSVVTRHCRTRSSMLPL